MAAAALLSPNRRTAIRRQPALGTVCHFADSDELGLVWNVSTSGVSMLLHEPLQPPQRIQGTLATLDGRGTIAVDLNVVHLRQLRTGDYFVGAQFDRELRVDELRPFLADGNPAVAAV